MNEFEEEKMSNVRNWHHGDVISSIINIAFDW